jgi:hypothetical protein
VYLVLGETHKAGHEQSDDDLESLPPPEPQVH